MVAGTGERSSGSRLSQPKENYFIQEGKQLYGPVAPTPLNFTQRLTPKLISD